MRYKRWVPLVLFLGVALLSAWLSPVLSPGSSRAASAPPGAVPALQAQVGDAAGPPAADYEAAATPGQIAALQAAVSLLLTEEDSQVYLPLMRH